MRQPTARERIFGEGSVGHHRQKVRATSGRPKRTGKEMPYGLKDSHESPGKGPWKGRGQDWGQLGTAGTYRHGFYQANRRCGMWVALECPSCVSVLPGIYYPTFSYTHTHTHTHTHTEEINAIFKAVPFSSSKKSASPKVYKRKSRGARVVQ